MSLKGKVHLLMLDEGERSGSVFEGVLSGHGVLDSVDFSDSDVLTALLTMNDELPEKLAATKEWFPSRLFQGRPRAGIFITNKRCDDNREGEREESKQWAVFSLHAFRSFGDFPSLPDCDWEEEEREAGKAIDIPEPEDTRDAVDLVCLPDACGSEGDSSRDVDLFNRLVQQALEDIPLRLGELRKNLAAGVPFRTRQLANRLRGVASLLETTELDRMADALERMDGGENRGRILALCDSLSREIERLRDALAEGENPPRPFLGPEDN